ncbi:ferrous iron transport protein A [Candidatus Bipolaricaulota bacterium]|nr:ferrous iron transport protein A [Candidatus Bipolaricaulota bacterium]
MSIDFCWRPLDALPPGQPGRVMAIGGGRGLALRLRSLGIRPGAVVRTVAQGPWRGPVLLEVDGCRVALGRGIARRIFVQPLP